MANHSNPGSPTNLPARRLKRAFDLISAFLGIIISSPLWLVSSLAIYLEDRGPIFFLQERCGRQRQAFKIIKFRTMRLPEKGKDPHKVTFAEHDPRVTRVGRLLRAAALDELPELINILKGEMSFVGPRPLPYRIEDGENARYKTIDEVPGHHLRSQVRPGLTGIAQVYAPKDMDRRNKFRYDDLYVREMSFWLDLKLVLLSLWITLRGKWERRRR